MASNPLRTHGLSTRAVHAGDPPREAGGPVNNPIVPSTSFFSAPEGAGEVLYPRYGNTPNHRALEQRIAALEGGEDCAVMASGMAAMASALLASVAAGDHVVAAQALYGGTRALLERELSRLGVATTFADFAGEEWRGALRPNTRALVVETPSNPLVRVLDLRPIAELAHARGATLIVDSTFASPINFRPLEHGADLVMHSATKYLGGHDDVSAGAIVGARERVETIRARALSFGPVLDAHAAWLVERGIKTLAVRMERHNRNGMAVARWCEEQPGIERVHYPGLPSHPDHSVAARLLDGFGGMLGIELRGGGEAASRFVASLRLAKYAPSLGGVETLVSEPRFTSHVDLSPEERERMGIRDGLVRFSLGIEDEDDLIADLEQALDAAGPA